MQEQGFATKQYRSWIIIKEETKSLSENLVSIQASPTQPTVFSQAQAIAHKMVFKW
jgi:hypothetical protein